jgi:hypothetical protein
LASKRLGSRKLTRSVSSLGSRLGRPAVIALPSGLVFLGSRQLLPTFIRIRSRPRGLVDRFRFHGI